MNKETELYLIKRIEELAGKNAVLSQDNDSMKRTIDNWVFVPPNTTKKWAKDTILKKAELFDVLSKFVFVKTNPVAREYKLVFTAPEIELNDELALSFEELLNG